MTTLILIRHGESKANEQGIFAGHLDVELTETGKRQANLTAEYIEKNFAVDKLYASDLKRAFDTGKSVADRLGKQITPTKELREISAGDWDGTRFDTLKTEYKDAYSVWLTDIGNAVCTNGESVRGLAKRVLNILTKIAEENEGKTVVCATHATPIRVMETLITYGDLNKMKDVPWVTNASVTVIAYENNEWQLIMTSEDSHLKDVKTTLPKNV